MKTPVTNLPVFCSPGFRWVNYLLALLLLVGASGRALGQGGAPGWGAAKAAPGAGVWQPAHRPVPARTTWPATGPPAPAAVARGAAAPLAVPVITGLSPASVPPGSGAFTLVVTGTGFEPTSYVSSTAPVSMTTYLSATQLSVDLPAGAVIGTYPVTVTNPGAGGGVSAPFNFYVAATSGPAPTISSFTPASAVAGTLVTVTGTNFTNGLSSVRLNGVSVGAYSVVSATQLTFTVSATSSTGRIVVATQGGTATSATNLVVTSNSNNPVPVITSLSPPSVPAGSGAFTLTINGTGFLPGSTVTFQGFPLPITYISATQISVALPAGATPGTYQVVVTNPLPGGGDSAPFGFVVPNPAVPTISSFAPGTAVAGTLVTVLGTGLLSATDVELNGVPVGTFTVVSDTQLTFVVSASSSTGLIVVTTQGGTATSATALVVTGNPTIPVPVITSLSPPSVPSGSGAFTLTITGTGFLPASTVTFQGFPLPATYISPTQISVALPAGAVAGSYPVIVANPGGGASAPFNLLVIASGSLPVITSFSPVSGPVGTTVVITGTNLGTPTAIIFNQTVTTSFTVVSATQIRVVVPVGASTGAILVLTNGSVVPSPQVFTVTTPTATLAQQERAGLALYPNPAQDLLTVALAPGAAPAPLVRVHDLTGRTLRASRLGADGQLSLRGLPAGLYTITVGEGAQAITRKLVKN